MVNKVQGLIQGGAKVLEPPSLNILMVEIGKKLGGNREIIREICEKTGKTDFEHPLEQYPRHARFEICER